MKLIKKKILFVSGSTGHTGTTYFSILLTGNIRDLGIFDTLDDVALDGQITEQQGFNSGYTFNTPSTNYNFSNYTEDSPFTYPYTVTGYSSSRLSELEKYVISSNPFVKYVTGGSLTSDGLYSYSSGSTGTTYVYYLGGIKYSDIMSSGTTATTTSFLFTVTGFSSANFDNKRIIKIEEKQNLVENTQLSKDVFISRQEQSVFERNYRLRAVGSLNSVLTYAGGNYFTIYNNT